MKKITMLFFVAYALIGNNAFGMRFKKTVCTKQYSKNISTHTTTTIKTMLSDHRRDIRKTMDKDWSTQANAEDLLKDLYFRNKSIIKLLNTEKNSTKAIEILEEQQEAAVLGLAYEDEINQLEDQLYKALKIEKPDSFKY